MRACGLRGISKHFGPGKLVADILALALALALAAVDGYLVFTRLSTYDLMIFDHLGMYVSF
jgi:hypothetical protein